MKNILKYLVLFLSLVIVFTGCRVAYRVILGIDSTPAWKTDKSLVKQAKRYGIPTEYNLAFDTTAYYRKLDSLYSGLEEVLDTNDKDSSGYFKLFRVYKDDTQPTQFRLFDQKGKGIFKLVNCYVDPPIPMDWNVNGCFDQFPPKLDIESLNSHYYDLNFLLECSSTVDNKKLSMADLPESDYYGVVIWNEFYLKPSRKLIKTIKKYVEDSDQSVHLIFINNQNAFLWQVMDSKQKQKVREFIARKTK